MNNSPCCQKCNKFAVNIGDTNLCFNPDCPCHSNSQEKKCPHGVWGTGCAVCFNEDRTPVHPRQPSEAWEAEFDLKYPPVVMNKVVQGREDLKSFIRQKIAEAREEGRHEALTELPELKGEDGKLFSRVIAKAMEAPFVEVALQHIVMRVSQKYLQAGHAAALKELKTDYDWEVEFDKQFVTDNLWEEEGGETKFVAIGNIKDFIGKTIAHALLKAKLNGPNELSIFQEGKWCGKQDALKECLEVVEGMKKENLEPHSNGRHSSPCEDCHREHAVDSILSGLKQQITSLLEKV